MICIADQLPTLAPDRQSSEPPASLEFIVDNVSTRARVLRWADDGLMLSVDDPANSFQDRLFVPQLLHLVWRHQRVTGTLQAIHACSIGRLRILVGWHRHVNATRDLWHGELATLCAS